MTLNEFKAWFDGFTENVSKVPTIKQWARIKERVAEIDGTAVTERIYVDRWYQPYRPYWPTYPYWTSSAAVTSSAADYAAGSDYTSNGVKGGGAAFDALFAMHAAGQAEAASMEN